MPEIGATLREARMRQRIDISEIEAQTKIRAKYLRALENEEWDLLPGPTFVKSFLRTYAAALGLDARASRTAATPGIVRLRLIPSGQVWVCLQAAGGRTLIGGRVIAPGSALPTYRSKRFEMTLGNGDLSLRINGRRLSVPAVQAAIGYRID